KKPALEMSVESAVDFFNYRLSLVIVEYGKEQALIILCFMIILVYFFKNLFRYLSLVFLAPVRNGIIRDVRQQLFEKTLILPLSYFSEERKGDLMSRMAADVQEIEW